MPTKNDRTSHRLVRFGNCDLLRHHQIICDDLWVRDGKILNPEIVFFDERVQAEVTVDCCGLLVVPGFIDVQINGMIHHSVKLMQLVCIQQILLVLKVSRCYTYWHSC